mmetsp:Transcript_115929/g.328059  ORF Transcript_115929/g.328059 Transcript_115929/m.328059 type:complete len:206 (+) Transcript_115929:661-1278(+)
MVLHESVAHPVVTQNLQHLVDAKPHGNSAIGVVALPLGLELAEELHMTFGHLRVLQEVIGVVSAEWELDLLWEQGDIFDASTSLRGRTLRRRRCVRCGGAARCRRQDRGLPQHHGVGLQSVARRRFLPEFQVGVLLRLRPGPAAERIAIAIPELQINGARLGGQSGVRSSPGGEARQGLAGAGTLISVLPVGRLLLALPVEEGNS